MPNYEKVNDVVAGSIAGVNGVAVGDIQNVNGQDKPSSGASLWVVGGNDRMVGYISNSDLLAGNDWDDYDAFAGGSSPFPGGSVDNYYLAYGKDGSGNGLWVSLYETDNPEITLHDDGTSGPWTGINTDEDGNNLSIRRFAVEWGNNVWIAVGKMTSSIKEIWRSTNGTDWEVIDISGITGIDASSESIYTIRSNGAGTWWFAQENRIYTSTQDGASGSWSLMHTLLDGGSDPGNIRCMAYTNNTLLVGIVNNGKFYTASTSDLTDWSGATTLANHAALCFDDQRHIASAAGRVVVVGGQFKSTFDINGKTTTMDESGADFSGDGDAHGNVYGVATDGSTWVACCLTGDMFYSTDGGDTWVDSTTDVGSINGATAEDMMHVAADVTLPL